jgi:hypothetical protein
MSMLLASGPRYTLRASSKESGLPVMNRLLCSPLSHFKGFLVLCGIDLEFISPPIASC